LERSIRQKTQLPENGRDEFSLSKDSVFFNTGTVGAMPKVVVEKMIDHLLYVASGIADWVSLYEMPLVSLKLRGHKPKLIRTFPARFRTPAPFQTIESIYIEPSAHSGTIIIPTFRKY
jgi:hypothetical protein